MTEISGKEDLALSQIQKIKDSNAVFLTADDVKEILGADPATIRRQALTDQSCMGFHISVIGNRTRIPRKAFLKWLGEE